MEVGNWMRNKETGEAVKIKTIGGEIIEYANDDVDGEVQIAKLAEHFDLLNDPSERNDIEFLVKVKIEAGEAETGLYDIGLSYLVVDRVDTEQGEAFTFQWFDSMMPFRNLQNN
jgi:hypothetical protein